MFQEKAEQAVAQDWLTRMRVLTAEIEEAMQAAAANRIATLKQCVERQQQICSSMSRPAFLQALPVDRAIPLDAALAAELIRAAAALRAANARYAAFLRHSGRTLRMFSALEQGAEHYLPGLPGAVLTSKAGRPSWSCEG